MLNTGNKVVKPNFVDKTIWTGDNLDILRGLNSETVDLIYLDPPFNSNRNYEAPVGSKAAGAAFKDAWTLSDLDVAWMGLIADEQPAIARLLDAARWTHGKGMQSYITMMAVRLLEMRRVLKPTGSIYLHCDPTASHYLKLLMDAIFGAKNFQNEILWKRFNFHADARRFGRVSDTVLFYSNSDSYTFNRQRVPFSKEYVTSKFKHRDENGRQFRLDNLNPPGGRGPIYEFHGVTKPWRYTQDNIRELERQGRIYHKSRVPQLKRYLDELDGQAVHNLWTDISPINPMAKERVGFPTQKPLALLERIIKASSNEGDMVLDPFAGCATACVAAEKLGRQWVGIDLSPVAYALVQERLAREVKVGSEESPRLTGWNVTHRQDIPRRTDIDAPKNYRQHKHVLYGQQEGLCNGCHMDFPFKIFEVDHIIPQKRGGTGHPVNLQLLCGHCNRLKGDRDQAYLMARLRETQMAPKVELTV